MSTFEERLAAESAPKRQPCKVCSALGALTPAQRAAITAAGLSDSAAARVLLTGRPAVVNHRAKGHDGL